MPCALLVEDDAQQLELRRQLLELAGWEALAVHSPAAALQVCRKAEVIITDLRFPDPAGDADAKVGLSFIRGLRENGCNTPIVVLSGWPDEIYGAPEEQMVSKILVKPVAMPLLLKTLDALACR